MCYKTICDNNCIVKCPNHLLQKLHIQNKPNCNFLFLKNKLGKSIWEKNANDFTTFDTKISLEYDALCDPCLKTFFKRKTNLNHLRKNRIINENNEVICSLKEFNDYRKHLHRMKMEVEAVVKREKNVLDLDLHRIKVSNKVFERIHEKDDKFFAIYGGEGRHVCTGNPIKHKTVLDTMKGRRMELECQRREKLLKSIENYNNRLQTFQQLQHLKASQLKERGIRLNSEIAKKQLFLKHQQKKHHVGLKRQIIAREKAMQAKMKEKNKNRPKTVDIVVKCPVEV